MDQLKFLCILAIGCNIVFCVGNLVLFTGQIGKQAMSESQKFQITIKQWLGITSIIELSYILSGILTAILSQCMQMKNNFLFLLWICHKLFHTLYQATWLIVMAIMHWGQNLVQSQSETSSGNDSDHNSSSNKRVLKTYLTCIIIVQFIFLWSEWFLWHFYIKKKPKQIKMKQNNEIGMQNSGKSGEQTSNAEFVSGEARTRDAQEKLIKKKVSKM